MNNENNNYQGELNDEAMDGVVGGWTTRKPMRCMDCTRILSPGRDKIYSYGNDGVVCAYCEDQRERERCGVRNVDWQNMKHNQ